MHIKELHNHVNKLRENNNLPLVSEEKFLQDITEMQLKGKIKVENGEVKPIKDTGE